MRAKIIMDLNKFDFKKEQMLFFCIFLSVLSFFFSYRFIFSPKLRQIKKVSVQIEQRKQDIERAKANPQHFAKVKETIKELQTERDYYQQRLTIKADMPQILKELNQMAEHLGIKFLSIRPLERKEALLPGAKDLLLQIPIRIKLKCGYHQLGKFINQIENSNRFMKIKDLNINADSNDIWNHQVELVITNYKLISK
jgi:Tfp pilus assembly protein PilO